MQPVSRGVLASESQDEGCGFGLPGGGRLSARPRAGDTGRDCQSPVGGSCVAWQWVRADALWRLPLQALLRNG